MSDRRPSFFQQSRAFVLSVAPILAMFFFARVALAEAYRIPSGSMEPTMLVGDWLWVNKLRYGPHIPFTNINLPGYAEPKRGEVAVFISPPQDPAIRIAPDIVTPLLVKRIVGVAGDTLAMRDGRLFVNGVAESRDSVLNTMVRDDYVHPIFAWQQQIAVAQTSIGAPVATPSVHNWGPLVVPSGHFFMLGDNRDNSVDSRFYGPVPRANVRGRPTFVYYSYDTERGASLVRALTEIRWSRLGTWIR
ncbi:MAG: signal peptidase I [Gemmatimonadaceae bacterium]|nr:signal peptidase I [Gemmatimonadaceae bacterium]